MFEEDSFSEVRKIILLYEQNNAWLVPVMVPSKDFLPTGQDRKVSFALKAMKTCRCQLMRFWQRSMNPLLAPCQYWYFPVCILLVSNALHIYLPVSSLFHIAFWCEIHCMAFLSNLWTWLWNIIFIRQSTLHQATTYMKAIVVHGTCITLKEEKDWLFSKPCMFCSTGKIAMNAFSVFLEIKRLMLSSPQRKKAHFVLFPNMRDACR